MDADTDRGEAIVRTAADRLDELRDLRAELDAQIAEQAVRAAQGLRLHVAERELEEKPVASDLVRRLYWQCPDVRVADIADALGFRSAREVIAAAGPGHFAEPCRAGCGTIVDRTVKSRSDAVSSGASRAPWTDPRVCSACREVRWEKHEREMERWRAESAERHREQLTALRQVRAAGVQPVARYVEYPGLGGTYLDPDYEPTGS